MIVVINDCGNDSRTIELSIDEENIENINLDLVYNGENVTTIEANLDELLIALQSLSDLQRCKLGIPNEREI